MSIADRTRTSRLGAAPLRSFWCSLCRVNIRRLFWFLVFHHSSHIDWMPLFGMLCELPCFQITATLHPLIQFSISYLLLLGFNLFHTSKYLLFHFEFLILVGFHCILVTFFINIGFVLKGRLNCFLIHPEYQTMSKFQRLKGWTS